MLTRCQYEHVFVPVRPMQILAVIDEDEIIFVDNQTYAVSDGEGGRLIMLAWSYCHGERGDDLNGPAPVELVCYHASACDLHSRLIGEFSKALDLVERRYKERGCEPQTKKILPFLAE